MTTHAFNVSLLVGLKQATYLSKMDARAAIKGEPEVSGGEHLSQDIGPADWAKPPYYLSVRMAGY